MTNERDYFIENLAMLMGSGMDILSAIRAIQKDTRSKRMQKTLDRLWDVLYEGSTLSRALTQVRLVDLHTSALIRIGERSGRLAENLALTALQHQKERSFRSKLRSAMMYPAFVFGLAIVVGLGIAWFILPKLAGVFSSLNVKLPAITKLLIGTGIFLKTYGVVVIPALIGLIIFLFFVGFVWSKTKRIGEAMLFSFPGIKKLLQEIELARTGYLLGTLLDAGVQVVEAVRTLTESTTFSRYQRLYQALAERLEEGNSFEKSFRLIAHVSRLIPTPIQQMIMAGEHSGRLASTFKSIGVQYEDRTEATTKNLSVILEPILLVIVWLGVVFVALAVILPIYSLIGGVR